MPEQCRNMIFLSGVNMSHKCVRPATQDGLCNICAAARRRGEALHARRVAAAEAKDDRRQERLRLARSDVVSYALLWAVNSQIWGPELRKAVIRLQDLEDRKDV